MRRSWVRVFMIGLILWALTVLVTFLTDNPNLLPTIVLLGSFLVPVTFVVWAYEHGRAGELTVPLLFRGFVNGGVLGILGASLLESYLLHPSPWMYAGVGLIEEAVKLVALMIVARGLSLRSSRDGLVLGAAVGFGFAAFESAGYAFNAMFDAHGVSLRSLVATEVLRGVLTPLGHGLWTAILGCVLFTAARRHGRWRLDGTVLLAYLGVSLLHALWDSMHGIAIGLAVLLAGAPWQHDLIEHGHLPEATAGQSRFVTVLEWGGLALISAAALVWLRVLAVRTRQAPPLPWGPAHPWQG
ncbi:PrsW family intramembrane metalloprotease [Actinomadura macrotermitis]|uniref:PrsW family intramembrane metalloprotease n=1 Tax=Actinomadura macrotermitis TaxID=2585200 RepID=A0A7K0BVN7_9ACTN|nr:PrsW family glutamic-type intramembrane protease [Actinomadura macrotermitis]MQY05136.1 hypothetical protein [Actinomadura macrotermitis]